MDIGYANSSEGYALGLRVGDWVEVRTAEEILATLDNWGCLDALPFMPEMLEYCGRTFRVFKVAHKTCDTIEQPRGRTMLNAVHLEGLRCDGKAHGGCQAGCLLFWKERWLKRVAGLKPVVSPAEMRPEVGSGASSPRSCCDLEALGRATRAPVIDGADSEARYRCQATELLRATTPLRSWDPRQYMKDLNSGNVRPREFVRGVAIAMFNLFQRWWGGHRYPYIRGLAGDKTPTEMLNLQPGELVQIRSKDEIMRTINAQQRNRGLYFDAEMVPHCGGTFRVLRRVEQIIEEKTGRMIRMPSNCIILEGVICRGYLSRNRLFCPRSIYPYWREIWLKRVEEPSQSGLESPR